MTPSPEVSPDPGPDRTVTALVETACTAAPDRFAAEFAALVVELWKDGEVTGLAHAAVPTLAARLDGVGSLRAGHLAVLLGLLAGAEHPEPGPVTAAVEREAPTYLRLLADAEPGSPFALALFFLLAHLPARAAETLALAERHGTGAADLSLLRRSLAELDPATAVLGRVFPSPAEWGSDGSTAAFDAAVTAGFTSEQIRRSWDDDTLTVRGNIGAKAWWAVRTGERPQSLELQAPPTIGQVPVPPPGPAAELFAPHVDAFACPDCRSALRVTATDVGCAGCGRAFPLVNGVVDLLGDGSGDGGDFLRRLSEVPTMGLFYEALARPAFLRLCGGNWGGAVSVTDEDAWITEHVRPVEGPVLDLAAGAGRWTEVLADAVGAGRVLALDVNPSMINVLRGRLPQVPALLAGGDRLPFADASLGAVLCWNALQAFPHHARAAVAEVGRCLRPGGTFTVLTFRRPDDPVSQWLLHCHRFPQHSGGLDLFDLDELRGWFAESGLTIRTESYPGTFVLVTAVREDV